MTVSLLHLLVLSSPRVTGGRGLHQHIFSSRQKDPLRSAVCPRVNDKSINFHFNLLKMNQGIKMTLIHRVTIYKSLGCVYYYLPCSV